MIPPKSDDVIYEQPLKGESKKWPSKDTSSDIQLVCTFVKEGVGPLRGNKISTLRHLKFVFCKTIVVVHITTFMTSV